MSAGFDLFIADMFGLYNRLSTALPHNRPWVISGSRRALAVLRRYQPDDDGQAMLLEIAVEEFEKLVAKAGGQA